ncbi:hypothetical protein [Tenacibaculum piscium]|uniref:hypothetical protein n=1 Tax=Tenacibaculum piscium TaxID=1458515 RepID=UPI001F295423|nr:hypothetical protein [Tenacibaculum piscium]
MKIGENPSTINSNSVLELESPDKVLVITKMDTAQMNAIQPLQGALVYNTTENCVFSYNGTTWRSLCDSASFITDSVQPINNNIGDFWNDSSNGNTVNIWNGLNWISLNSKIKTGTGIPTNITAPNPIAGDVYIDLATAKTYTYNTATSTWVTQTSTNTGASVEVTIANTAPTTNNKGDFWINDTAGLNNPTSIYDGANWVLLNSTNTTTGTTAPANPNNGDFWIDNTNPSDNKTNIWDGSNWVLLNSTSTNTGNSVNTTTGTTPPTNPNNGDFWIDNTNPSDNKTNIWDGSNWVLLNSTSTNTGNSVNTTTGTTAPTNPNNGDFWIDNTNPSDNKTNIWDGSNWVLLNSTSTNTQNPVKVINNTTAPANPNNGDFWVNPTTNETKIWDGTTSTWVLLNGNPKKGTGIPTDTTAPNSVAGDIYVDIATGTIYAYTGTAWITQTNTNTQNPVIASNGLTIDDTTDPTKNNIQLGGKLLSDTTIDTDGKAFAIKNLQTGDITNDDIVTIDRTTGELKKVTLNTVLKQEVTKLTVTTPNQVIFTKPNFGNNITVYRNGVRVDFTLENSDTEIKLESDAKCYAGDQIRIVQLY